ncbi:S phase cyclin A-associated protein in the endoplasmic reticulum [Dermatophagoides farinae]|uniref:S phase cyclin A-associated protein in the endoplasmic reticulum n=1 Tax=Dermatophagoides farinae TaxID=6954 RepID=A0A922IGN0_DERFA|nr:S phase cyclin A-associated protein in the endoplasmic reticulum-like isoform X2 [Dermatophagoides farinae]KAH7642290.1 hypothetical protein HUG17_5335 [Dermatophagoides farinae]KAH9529499.1 hypothetical protein DERF_003380 [Dermatophagoides farinae]
MVKLESINRTRSASLGRTRNFERRSRYWTFLFDHLNRIIDEIYQNCEEDESIDECREVILNLQNHIRDFESLIEWLKLNKDLESTPQRPSSVSWEVRKRLPEKSLFSCYLNDEKTKGFNQNNEELKEKIDAVKNNNDEDTISHSQIDESLLTKSDTFETLLSNYDNGNGLMSSVHSDNQSDMKHVIKKDTVSNTGQNHRYSMPNISSSKLDDDGFQVVRYRQRNKVTELKIIDHNDNSTSKHNANLFVHHNDRMDSGNMIGDNRAPCRVLKLHEKFSSPSRRRPVGDTLKKQEEKQAKAQEAREKLLEKRAEKFKDIFKKVEEIKAQKEEQQMQLRLSMEMRLQRAGKKRQEQINKIVRKAHDEDEKVSEILFINSLEADTKKHEIFSKEKVYESRLQDLQEERQRKLEEKASKEKAFEERRKAIEAEKQARIEKLKEQRKLKVMKIQRQFQEKEKERLELAFQKELDRKSKISALNALHAAEKEELQKKILAKQEESKRRHEENMEQIRQKALELSVKKSSSTSDEALVCVPYDTVKMCALCKIIIKSEVYLFGHLRGKRHNDAIIEQNEGKIPSPEELENFNLKFIIDAQTLGDGNDDFLKSFQDCDSEKLKQAKKKSKKLKQKLANRAMDFEKTFDLEKDVRISEVENISKDSKQKLAKIIKDLGALNSNDRISGQWPIDMIRSFERFLFELDKLFKKDSSHILYFYRSGGLLLFTKILSRILNSSAERPTSLTDNANNKLIALYRRLCQSDFRICRYFFRSQNIITVQEIFYHRINLCVNSNNNNSNVMSFPYDSVVGSLCELFSTSFDQIFAYYSCNYDNDDETTRFIRTHLKEIINYLVLIGVVDKLSMILTSFRGSINELPQQSLFIKQIITFSSSLAKLLNLSSSDDFHAIAYGVNLQHDGTQFMLTLKVTQLCGTVSLLYGFLLHSGAPVRDENVPPIVPDHTLNVTLEIIRFFNYLILLDINLIQSILGSEGLSLQIRHICSYLIWYCSHHLSNSDLLNEVILLIGNFVVLNNDNQTLLQSGQRPTVVQQLCSLPFDYFSDNRLKQILFPTLIVCCYNNNDNLNILKQEMSTTMLSKFIDQEIVNNQLDQLDSDRRENNIISKKWSLTIRFPKHKWIEAKSYFERFR